MNEVLNFGNKLVFFFQSCNAFVLVGNAKFERISLLIIRLLNNFGL